MRPLHFPLLRAILLVCLLTSGCRTPRSGPKPPVPVPGPVDPTDKAVSKGMPPTDNSAKPPPEASGTKTPTFQTGDMISLLVFQEPNLSGDFTVGEDGGFRHPLLGWVHVKGMSSGATEVLISRLLKDGFLVDPKVSVRMQSVGVLRKIVINGQVNRPGEYEFPANDKITLLGAIARAGGLTNIARPSQVRIVRSKDGVKETIPVDVGDLFSGRAADIPLQPEDKIFVPESTF
jgi:polysaccharide biosynthesis/export protein